VNPTTQTDLGTPESTLDETVTVEPETGANVVTTEYSDWATNCPEYKVTAVQVAPAVHRSKWQHGFEERAKEQGKILETT